MCTWMCDAAAVTGFSEYWYLFSHAVEKFPRNVTVARGRVLSLDARAPGEASTQAAGRACRRKRGQRAEPRSACHFKVPGVSSGPNVGVVNDSRICSNAA